jgi:hypothetical protein
MARVLWHVTMPLDGFIAGPDDAIDWVFEYPEPNATVEEAIRTTGLVLDWRPNASPECWQLDAGLTARHWRAIAPDIGVHR